MSNVQSQDQFQKLSSLPDTMSITIADNTIVCVPQCYEQGDPLLQQYNKQKFI